MVCVPCIVIPVLLFVFHKFFRPILQKFFPNWFGSPAVESSGMQFTDKILSTAEGKFIKEKIDANPVMMFSKTTCGYCKMAKKVLDESQVIYELEEIDLREDCDKLQDLFKELTGEKTVPRVFIGGKCIGGGTQVMRLSGQGQLVTLMKEADAKFKESKKDS